MEQMLPKHVHRPRPKMDLSKPFKGFGTRKSDMLEHEKASRVRDHLDRKMNRLDAVLSDADLEIFQLTECADQLQRCLGFTMHQI